jgi:anti-sigma factor RsiW
MPVISALRRRLGRDDPISCRELVELITDYLEGALDVRDRRRFERHIEGCPHCTVYLEQLRVTLAALGSLREDSLEPALRDELLARFADWRAS